MSLAVEKYGNRYLGEREVTLRVSPYRTMFGRERWRAQVLVEQPTLDPSLWHFRESGGGLGDEYVHYWPSFKSASRDEAVRRAREWVVWAREESRRADRFLAREETVAAEPVVAATGEVSS